MRGDVSLAETWINTANEAFNRDVNDVPALQSSSEASSKIFSHFEYSNSCGGEPLRVPMEPLVGLFRHPFVSGCIHHRPDMIDSRHDAPGEFRVCQRSLVGNNDACPSHASDPGLGLTGSLTGTFLPSGCRWPV